MNELAEEVIQKPEKLERLGRKDLQALCKHFGLKATGKVLLLPFLFLFFLSLSSSSFFLLFFLSLSSSSFFLLSLSSSSFLFSSFLFLLPLSSSFLFLFFLSLFLSSFLFLLPFCFFLPFSLFSFLPVSPSFRFPLPFPFFLLTIFPIRALNFLTCCKSTLKMDVLKQREILQERRQRKG